MRTGAPIGNPKPAAWHYHRYNGMEPVKIAELAGCTVEELDELVRRDWFTRTGMHPEIIYWEQFGGRGGLSISKQCLPRLEVGLRMLRAAHHRASVERRCAAGVYVVRTEEGPRRYKIGFASNLASRMDGLRGMSPVALTVMAFMPRRTISTERRLHRVFRRNRLHGEWFEESPALLRLIERYRWEEK